MPVVTNFGVRSFDAFLLLASTVATDYGLWRFTEGGGTTVVNRAAAGTADMVLSGADVASIWTTDDRLWGDASLGFDAGVSDFIASAAYSASLDLSGVSKFTWLGWVYYEGPGENAAAGTGGHIIEDGGQFRIRAQEDDKLNVEITTGSTNDRTWNTVLSTDTWYFLAFTYDSGSNTGTIYYAQTDDTALTSEADSITWNGAVATEQTAAITVGDRVVGGLMWEGKIAEQMLVPGVAMSEATLEAIFLKPWLYFSQRPMDPHGDGVRSGVLRQRTADGDSIGIQITPAVDELMRQWDAMNDTDRAAFKTWWKEMIHGGADLFYLLDTADRDSDTERKVRFVNNPFAGYPSRRVNRSELRWELIQLL